MLALLLALAQGGELIPGTRLCVDPPEGWTTLDGKPGFIAPDGLGSLGVTSLPAGQFTEMSTKLPEMFRTAGKTVHAVEERDVAGRAATRIHFTNPTPNGPADVAIWLIRHDELVAQVTTAWSSSAHIDVLEHSVQTVVVCQKPHRLWHLDPPTDFVQTMDSDEIGEWRLGEDGVLSVGVGPARSEVTPNTLAPMIAQYAGMTAGEPKPVRLSGYPGLQVTLTGSAGDIAWITAIDLGNGMHARLVGAAAGEDVAAIMAAIKKAATSFAYVPPKAD